MSHCRPTRAPAAWLCSAEPLSHGRAHRRHGRAPAALAALVPLAPAAAGGASFTGGLVHDADAHRLLPSVTPGRTTALVALALLPALAKLWRVPSQRCFAACLVYSGLCFFMLSWHVHEKAVLMAALPLSPLVLALAHGGGPERGALACRLFLMLGSTAPLSLFPLLHQPPEWGWKVSTWLAYMALLLATPRKHMAASHLLRWNDLASNAHRPDWLNNPGRAAAALVVCHGPRALLRPPRGPRSGARTARAGAGGAGAGGAAAIPTPVSRSNLRARRSLMALAGWGAPGWHTQRSARWACTGVGGSRTACAATRRRPRTEPWR